MKSRNSVIIYFSFILIAISCKQDKYADTTFAESDSLVIQYDSLLIYGPNVIMNADTSSSRVLMKFPKSLGLTTADSLVVKELKRIQFENLVTSLYLEENTPKPKNMKDAIDQFIKMSETDPLDPLAVFMPYEYESVIDTSYVGKEIITFSFSEYTFTGGAHPNTFSSFVNFEKKRGNIIYLDAMIQDTTSLKKIVKAGFEKHERSELGKDYDVNNYFFGDTFLLPQNYAITRKGLYCFYNPYEAASYARGPIEFTIPWQELTHLISSPLLKDLK